MGFTYYGYGIPDGKSRQPKYEKHSSFRYNHWLQRDEIKISQRRARIYEISFPKIWYIERDCPENSMDVFLKQIIGSNWSGTWINKEECLKEGKIKTPSFRKTKIDSILIKMKNNKKINDKIKKGLK